jgi:hypothetical protein
LGWGLEDIGASERRGTIDGGWRGDYKDYSASRHVSGFILPDPATHVYTPVFWQSYLFRISLTAMQITALVPPKFVVTRGAKGRFCAGKPNVPLNIARITLISFALGI